MNTNKLKAYAPKARVAFMEAVKNRAAKLGIFEDRINDITIDGDSAIIEKEVYTRKQGQQRNQLVKRIEALGTHDGKFVHKDGFNQFINETAFTWFNRLTAIRYMEVNEYLDHGFRVLSKYEGAQFGEGFEILNSAADVADDLGLNKEQIINMVLDGNKEEELYRTLLLGQCHQLSEAMPFMFEKLDDATELLLPDNLTKTDSILKDLVNDIPEDNWRDFRENKGQIEIIGWLYQFYITDQKKQVDDKVRQGANVTANEIPAKTQLFTPNWIVKYLVHNSLGNYWLSTYPESELKSKMEYYITPAEQSDDVIEQLKAITPTSIDPEKIKVLDPACGSGHILVEVYEVLREIYLERGYRLREIPELILTKNIYGLDIDDRAAQMAAFAVLMKAREDDKRIFTRDTKLNIHSIRSTENLNINQLWTDLDFDGNKQTGSMGDLFAEPKLELDEPSAENRVHLDLLCYLKEQFIDAKNLGSLVEINSQYLKSLTTLQEKLAEKELGNEPTAKEAAQTLFPIVQQALLLTNKYDVVIANPPYLGSNSMNTSLKNYTIRNFSDSKSDLYTVFIDRGFQLLKLNGFNAMVTMESWMFLSAYKNFRRNLLETSNIVSLCHMEKLVMGIAFRTVAAIFQKQELVRPKGTYCFVEKEPQTANFPPKNERLSFISSNEFKAIPGHSIAYWLPEKIYNAFETQKISRKCEPKIGIQSGDNEKFYRLWFEVANKSIRHDIESINDTNIEKVWVPLQRGGDARKWFGNNSYIVNMSNEAKDILSTPNSSLRNSQHYFNESITWNRLSQTRFYVRHTDKGYAFDDLSPFAIPINKNEHFYLLALLGSSSARYLIAFISTGRKTEVGHVANLPQPLNFEINSSVSSWAEKLVCIAREDWNSNEFSIDFKAPQIINLDSRNNLVSESYNIMRENWTSITDKALDLEEKINKHFSTSYGLSERNLVASDLTDITLKCNPCNRYQNNLDAEKLLQSDSFCELISYSIGCMMGRYSLNREGLVYAHSGNQGFKDLVSEGVYKTFPADDDGIVPLADEDWGLEDDATTRFREFMKAVWGEDHLQENLDFVAESLCLDAIKPLSGKKGQGESSLDTIRRYFSMQFYKDHLKTYKKRPIYWLFSSGKAKAFECLVYLHRYNEGTLSRIRTEYVTPLMGRLESHKNILEDSKATASGAKLRAIDKELKTIEKKQAELVTFDEELKHFAEMKTSLDLDDGVKVNYGKFGNLLADVKAIHGKNPEAIK